MAILLVIVMLTTRIFHQATVAWESGARKAELDMTGRSIVDFIARELEQAVCDSVIIKNTAFDVPNGGDYAKFVMMNAEPTTNNRTLRAVYYKYDSGSKTVNRESRLWRSYEDYKDIAGFNDARFSYETNGLLCGPDLIQQFVFKLPPGNTNTPPLYVDIEIVVGLPQDKFVTNTMSFSARAYTQLRKRYSYD